MRGSKIKPARVTVTKTTVRPSVEAGPLKRKTGMTAKRTRKQNLGANS